MATNFYAADLNVAEKIIQTFPSISKGLIVEKVICDLCLSVVECLILDIGYLFIFSLVFDL